ncbi:hypothetical protein [Streptomyces sp. NPDC008141]|uniref:hypothetical protein n=1 Tax=Streptomyces sp. NPDC008141 TaxID=3364815 RepID=UPI0036F0DCBC
MRIRVTTAVAASGILLIGLASCSSGGEAEPGDAKAKSTRTATPTATAAADTADLAPVWTPKLDAAAGANAESTAACRTPSSSECAGYIDDIMIMTVVDGRFR